MNRGAEENRKQYNLVIAGLEFMRRADSAETPILFCDRHGCGFPAVMRRAGLRIERGGEAEADEWFQIYAL